MTNHILITITSLIILLSPIVNASGSIELIIGSPRTILIEPTVCANFECPGPDELSQARKVQAGQPLRFRTEPYEGEARKSIDVHLKLIDPDTNELITIQHFKPLADNEWNSDLKIVTTLGFNVTVQLRNVCKSNYHGNRCGRYCMASLERHWECTSSGERRCSAGWSGPDCSSPVCSGGCNGRGRCVAPNQCLCSPGFNGTRCEECIPRPGCVNGDCLNGSPLTCKCRPGFIGSQCNIHIKICSLSKPCKNGGICSIDTSAPEGFQCKCPFDFLGQRCETPLKSVRCSDKAEHVCQNGGKCFSLDEKSIQCKCPPGFTGKFCEIGGRTHRDCSTMKCPTGSECHMSGDVPACIFNVIPVMATNEPAKNESDSDVSNMDSTLLILLSVCICGLTFFSVMILYMTVRKPRNESTPSTTSSSDFSPNSSTVYKVCIIDAENGGNGSESKDCCHQYSPPPAYSSPVPRIYRSLPTNDESSFRKLDLETVDL